MVWEGIKEAHEKACDNMVITTAMVKELREKSGWGMQTCKQALIACNGDFKLAEAYMLKRILC